MVSAFTIGEGDVAKDHDDEEGFLGGGDAMDGVWLVGTKGYSTWRVDMLELIVVESIVPNVGPVLVDDNGTLLLREELTRLGSTPSSPSFLLDKEDRNASSVCGGIHCATLFHIDSNIKTYENSNSIRMIDLLETCNNTGIVRTS